MRPLWLAWLLVLAACAPPPEAGPLEPLPHVRPEPEGAFRVAVAGILSPRRAAPYWSLAKELWPEGVIQGRKTYGEVLALLRDGRIDLAFLCTLAAAQSVREGYGEVIARSVPASWTRYRSVVVVGRQTTIQGLQDLVGASVALVDPLSNTGQARLFRVLKGLGYRPEAVFRRRVYTYSHDRAIEAVVRGLVEAAAVDGMILDALMRENPEWWSRVRVIWEGPEDPPPPVVVRKGLSRQAKAQVLRRLQEVGDQLLEVGVAGFAPAEDTPYLAFLQGF